MMADPISLEQRLACLPRKVSVPLRLLRARGQVEDPSLLAILIAGEITGDNSHLMAFAVAYLTFESRGVPIRDTILMAQEHHRKINFAWGGNRWRNEHDHLSRIATLKRLAAANQIYDLSQYEAILPDDAKTRLIRTSRRLGFEGLRQRHCIASYHSSIRAGDCAILSLIAEKRRWTVEIRLTGNAEKPVRIEEIKGRFNRTPTAPIRRRIFDRLGVRYDVQRTGAVETGEGDDYMGSFRILMPHLRARGVEQVTVLFEGSGDSGSIDDVLFKGGPSDLPAERIAWTRQETVWQDGAWIEVETDAPLTFREVIESACLDWLNETGVDWYNNDGGFGELEIDVQAETVSLDVSTRFTQSETAYYQERNLLTGEEM